MIERDGHVWWARRLRGLLGGMAGLPGAYGPGPARLFRTGLAPSATSSLKHSTVGPLSAIDRRWLVAALDRIDDAACRRLSRRRSFADADRQALAAFKTPPPVRAATSTRNACRTSGNAWTSFQYNRRLGAVCRHRRVGLVVVAGKYSKRAPGKDGYPIEASRRRRGRDPPTSRSSFLPGRPRQGEQVFKQMRFFAPAAKGAQSAWAQSLGGGGEPVGKGMLSFSLRCSRRQLGVKTE